MLLDLTKQAERLKLSGFSRDRLRSPGDLVARMRPRFPEFGVTRLAEITGLDVVGWPVWAAVRPNAPTLSVSQGKGPTPDAARASALMEAVEMCVAERVASGRLASADDLEGAGERFDLLPAMVRRGRAAPAPSDPLHWIAGHDLASSETVWLPLQAIHLDASDPLRAYWQSTDGVGSGSLMLEAVMHGLFERVERDADELFQLRPDAEIEAACIDLDAVSPDVAALARTVARAGVHLRAFDMTNDLGIPAVFATVSPPPDGDEAFWHHFDLASGSAARLDFGAAALAAIGEALQSRLTVISGARDDFQPVVYDERIAPDLLVYPRATPARVPHRPAAAEGATGLGEVLERLEAAAVGRVIAVPLHEDEDFAVAKLVVPGLELPPGARAVTHGSRARRAMAHRSGQVRHPPSVSTRCAGAEPAGRLIQTGGSAVWAGPRELHP